MFGRSSNTNSPGRPGVNNRPATSATIRLTMRNRPRFMGMRLRLRAMRLGLWAIASHMHARRRDGGTSPSHDLAGVHVGVRAGTMVSPASTLRGSVVKQRNCRERRGRLFQFKLPSACGRLQVVGLLPGDAGIAVMDLVRSMAVSADA